MTCRTIRFFVTLAFTILVALLAADAQPATTVYRVGRLLAAGSPAAGPDPAAEELNDAFAAMTRAGADAVIAIADLAAKSRLPVMYSWREWVEAGCLMSYGPSRPDVKRRAATYVDKILKGAKPADLPVEQATTFEFVINLKTAQALGLTIPPSLLIQVTDVIR
jgi:ABC transporter substrate binding protein